MSEIESAFAEINRADFLPEDSKTYAEVDAPLQIGYGQTNSQPYTVRLMLEWLNPLPGENILDLGSGSGWTSALLGKVVGKNGEVHAVEIIPELVKFGKQNASKTKLKNVHFHQAKKEILGWPENAPYDKILVSASSKELPEELIDQLKDKGRMVIPIKNSIWVIEKLGSTVNKTEHPGFVFVPLVKQYTN